MKNSSVTRQTVCGLILALAGLAFSWTTPAQVPEPEKPLGDNEPAAVDRVAPFRQRIVDLDETPINRGEIVVFGQNVHLRKNERCQEIVVIGGDAIIEGTVQRGVVVLFGSTKLTGSVGGDVVTIMGPAEIDGKVRGCFVNILGAPSLGPGAVIEREVVTVGGRLRLDPESVIKRGRQEFALADSFQWLVDWFRGGLLKARPLPPQLMWAWFVAGSFLAIYAFMTVIFARPLKACVNTLDDAPVAAFFVGLLSLILFLPALLLLAFTVVGAPLLMLSMVVAVVFGKVAIYQFTGQQLGRQLNVAALQLPLVALLLGAAIFYLLYTIPILGFLAWGLGFVWGVGAVLMAVFASFKREPKASPAPILSPASVPANPGPGAPPTLEGTVPPLALSPTDAVHLARAGFWVRVGATIIDLLLVGVLSAFLLHGLTFPILLVVYHVAMWTWKGTTIGGVVFGLKIVRLDGRSIDFAVALVRSLFSIISFAFLLFGFFWTGWDKEKQSWHDKIAGTVIVKVPAGVSLL